MFSSWNINTLNVSRSWSLALKSSPLAGQSCQIKRQCFPPDFKIYPMILAKLCLQISCCAIFGNSGAGLLQARQWQQCMRPRVQLCQEEHFRKWRSELRQKRYRRRRLVRETDFSTILPRLWSGIRGRQASVYNSEFHFKLFVSYLPPLQLNDNDTILL